MGGVKTYMTPLQLLVITESPLGPQMEVHANGTEHLAQPLCLNASGGPSLVLDSNFDPETTLKSACKVQTGLCD